MSDARPDPDKGCFSLAIVDIDNSKQINDTYGHYCGDQVLVSFAQVLQDNVRETDAVGRWGGEEFILLLPETGLEAAATACEKIRGIMARSSVCYQDCQIMVTATFGVSQYQVEGGIEETLRYADEAMYRGKQAGRDRIVRAGDR